ncbi:MAG: DNA-3-methyladenine glycosylase 2 family protein [Sporocytophaga sp.]|uniref:DNA-3-methyladenine glycosylase family protein n=1 Tax=Sporocytophaga sp. TaxID=2231183 RepID=UPI001B0F634D|nr:DNA glycosylase [Sporocytophaga sp.]MBO9703045.1 DNA-3-methyladenine glycosylase 2 family protein [Sporocytophaga sp.]
MVIKNNIITVKKPPLFSFAECLWFLDRNYDDCAHTVKQDAVWKALQLGEENYLLKIYEKDKTIKIEVVVGPASAKSKKLIESFVVEWFDLNNNLEPFYKALRKDKQLSYMYKDFYGLRLMGITDLFESLCWCIIGQQINLSFAYKLKRRLVERFGIKLEYEGSLFYIFPDFKALAQASAEELKAMQFSSAKAAYLINTAQAFSDGLLSKSILQSLPDEESRHKLLTSFRGIGTWTANYVLMKTIRDPNSIPHGDAGLLKALINHDIIEDKKDTQKIKLFFERYKNMESYIVIYLWRSLAIH